MQNLTRAHNELYRRSPDEHFPSLDALWRHCREQKERSIDQWHPPVLMVPEVQNGGLALRLDQEGDYRLNDWSFTQLCRLAEVSKDTLNKLAPQTAREVLRETMPGGTKPLQVLTHGESVRSIHSASYTRLYNADLLAMAQEFAVDFQPPQEAAGGGTGLYCGEQDMFCFLIDPLGWTEIEGEAFAPGFFLWNSEVGRRTVGVQTFWFQAVCQNHIVWDAVEVVEFSRKHTARVHESMDAIRRIIENLNAKRDERRDGFAKVIRNAMQARIGNDAEEALKALHKHGFSRALAQQALEIARTQGRFTIFAVVDALTRLAGKLPNAGDRIEADEKAAALLTLAA
jgi:histone H3/H4